MKLTNHKTIFTVTFILFSGIFTFAQTERDRGIELYKKGDYKSAVKLLETGAKNNPGDFETFFWLGRSFLQVNKLKQAQEAFETASRLNPRHAKTLDALALTLISRKEYKKAIAEAEKAIALDGRDYEAYYFAAMGKAQIDDFQSALDYADKSAKLKPDFASAYLLKIQIRLKSLDDKSYFERHEQFNGKYGTIGENLSKYATLTQNTLKISREEKESLLFFADYYKSKKKSSDADTNKSNNSTNDKQLKILKKPLPDYLDEARQAGAEGTITALVAFTETGKVSYVFLLSRLGYGLDEEAIKAAKAIKFEPAQKDGRPITTARLVQYAFSGY